MADKLSGHGAMRHEVVRIGAEREPVLVVDDVFAEPDAIIDYAASLTYESVSDALYPGVRAPMPPSYGAALRDLLGPLIEETFDLAGCATLREWGSFSLVTTPPERLSVPQRIPHFDTVDSKQLALLHYLCRPEQGGTSFYRHRASGFETVSETRLPLLKQTLLSEFTTHGPPPARYVDAGSPLFERIANFDAAFNRVLVYRSAALHSAAIPLDAAFSADPRTGRLTANLFLAYG